MTSPVAVSPRHPNSTRPTQSPCPVRTCFLQIPAHIPTYSHNLTGASQCTNTPANLLESRPIPALLPIVGDPATRVVSAKAMNCSFGEWVAERRWRRSSDGARLDLSDLWFLVLYEAEMEYTANSPQWFSSSLSRIVSNLVEDLKSWTTFHREGEVSAQPSAELHTRVGIFWTRGVINENRREW